jgi:hypothetical protein
MDLKPKVRTEQEWTDYQIVEWGPFSYSLSFRNIVQTAVLLIACYWSYNTAALNSSMQVAQTAYLMGGLDEKGSNGGIVHYCKPVWVNGSFVTQGAPFISYDCRSEDQVRKDCQWQDIMNANISRLNISGVPQ